MNNAVLNEGQREHEGRYDPVAEDPRVMALEPDRHEAPPREGSTHAAKLASLSILFAIMVVFGTIAVVSNNKPKTSSTQASSENLYGPASVSIADKKLTETITDYPKTYKSRAIPQALIDEATKKYIAVPEAERKAYIINRLILYYIYDDVLTTNSISHSKITPPLTFDSIEATVPELAATMKQQYPQPDVFVTQYISRFTF